MGFYRTFTHYRVVAPVPGHLRRWAAGLRAIAPPFGEWLSEQQIILQDVRAPSLDLDRAIESLHGLALALGPVSARVTGSQAIARAEDIAVALTLNLDPALPDLFRILPSLSPDRSADKVFLPVAARPYLVLVEDLGSGEVEAVRAAIAEAPGLDPFPIDRLQILGTKGRAGWWHEIESAKLGGGITAPANDRPILRHARGWRLAG